MIFVIFGSLGAVMFDPQFLCGDGVVLFGCGLAG